MSSSNYCQSEQPRATNVDPPTLSDVDTEEDEFASASEWEDQEDGKKGRLDHRVVDDGPDRRPAVGTLRQNDASDMCAADAKTTAALETAIEGPPTRAPASPTTAGSRSDRQSPMQPGKGDRLEAPAPATSRYAGTESITDRSSGSAVIKNTSKKAAEDVEQPAEAAAAAAKSLGEQAQEKKKNAPPSSSEEAERPTTTGTSAQREKFTAQTSPNQQSSGGWGGWGWGILKSVTQELESPKFDNLVNKASSLGGNLRAAAARTVDNVYEALDPEYGKEKEALRDGSKAESPPASASEHKNGSDEAAKSAGSAGFPSEHGSDVTAEVKRTASAAAESVLLTIDKTFDFASNALGTAVLGGYRKLEAANLQEKLGYLQQEVVSSEVAHVGENVVHTGLSALEALGRRAAEILNEDRRRVLHESKVSKAGRSTEGQRPTLDLCFEDNCGRAHLQALSMLSSECEIKVASLMQALDTGEGGRQAVERAKEAISEMNEMFDPSKLLGELEEVEESACLFEAGANQAAASLEDLGIDSSYQLRQLQAMMREHLEFKQAEKEKLIKDLEAASSPEEGESPKRRNVEVVVLESVRRIEEKAIRAMANFAEKSCEQMLRVAEALLMRIAEDKIMKNGVDGKPLAPTAAGDGDDEANEKSAGLHVSVIVCAKSVRQLTVILLTDLQYLSTLYVQAAAYIVQPVKDSSSSLETKSPKRDVDVAKKMVQDLCHQLLVDAGRAMSFVQETVQCNLAILKLMLLQRLSSEKVAAAEAGSGA